MNWMCTPNLKAACECCINSLTVRRRGRENPMNNPIQELTREMNEIQRRYAGLGARLEHLERRLSEMETKMDHLEDQAALLPERGMNKTPVTA